MADGSNNSHSLMHVGVCLAVLVLTGCGGIERYDDPAQYRLAVNKLDLVGAELTKATARLKSIGFSCLVNSQRPMRPPFDDMACERRSTGLACVQPQFIYLHYRKDEQRVAAVTPMLGKDVCL
jgi:hypothetical protein